MLSKAERQTKKQHQLQSLQQIQAKLMGIKNRQIQYRQLRKAQW